VSETAAEKPRIRAYRCPECKVGLVVPHSRDGRFVQYRDVIINIPMSVFLPRCNTCRADIIDPATDIILQGVLAAEYKLHEKEIKAALERLRRRKGIH
jgi:hypothetical protein